MTIRRLTPEGRWLVGGVVIGFVLIAIWQLLPWSFGG